MGFLVLLTFGLADHADSGWWAAWGGWIGGLGSTAAAVTAVWIAVEGWRRSDRLAREQAARLDDQESRELASKFGVWIDKQTVELDTVAKNFVGVETSHEEYRVMYSNSGSQPVYRVVLVIRFFAARKDVGRTVGRTRPTSRPQPLPTRMKQTRVTCDNNPRNTHRVPHAPIYVPPAQRPSGSTAYCRR
jgi:hypothetical protein